MTAVGRTLAYANVSLLGPPTRTTGLNQGDLKREGPQSTPLRTFLVPTLRVQKQTLKRLRIQPTTFSAWSSKVFGMLKLNASAVLRFCGSAVLRFCG